MAELSVVVPVYRVERYLEKCVDSLLNQSFRDMEIILVDDGSPDRCPALCDACAEKDARVRVIHQANQGSVKARRRGLMEAVGEYVAFVDGDDWLAGEMYAPMLALAREHQADLVVSGYRQGNEAASVAKRNAIDSGVYRGDGLRALRDRALFSGRYYEPGIIPALWNKLIRRDLLLSLGDLVHEEVRMGDDAAVTYPLIAAASCVVVQNELQSYCYREAEGSMSRSFDERYFDRVGYLIDGLRARLGGDVSLLNQLNYYTLFVLEVGFGQLIAARKAPWTVCRVINAQMERFGLTDWLEGMDQAALEEPDARRLRLLSKKRAAGYVFTRIWEMLAARMGS